MTLSPEITDAINQGKRAIARDDNADDWRHALLALLEALGEGEEPACDCLGDETGHATSCPAYAWQEAGLKNES